MHANIDGLDDVYDVAKALTQYRMTTANPSPLRLCSLFDDVLAPSPFSLP